MEWIPFWLIGSAVVGIIAASRGRSAMGWSLIALLFSPVIGLVLALALPSLKRGAADGPSEATHVRCASCAEWVLPEAKVCKHCGAALTPDDGFHVRQAYEAEMTQKKQGRDALMVLGYAALVAAVVAMILV